MNRTFYSKVDGWYYVLIAVIGGHMIAAFWAKEIIPALIALVGTCWCIRLLTRIRYIVTADDVLVIETGHPFPAVRIPVADIVSAQRSRCLLASPALSLDRVKIIYRFKGKENCALISPLKREEMMQALKKRNPQINFLAE